MGSLPPSLSLALAVDLGTISLDFGLKQWKPDFFIALKPWQSHIAQEGNPF